MRCPQCKAENSPNQVFCTSCGTNLISSGSDTIINNRNTIQTEQFPEIERGKVLSNRFKIIKQLGQGGMGRILLAEDMLLKRSVAIKQISKEGLTEDNAGARFLREARTSSKLDHNNICTIYGFSDSESEKYIIMQYIDGVTLSQIINNKKLSINKITDIALQICEGMIEAHAHNIIHRDLKPSNIMIDRKGIIKILDFGLAKFETKRKPSTSSDNINITEKGVVMGTVSYMSPEQAEGLKTDLRTDIFSFGTVLFELIDSVNPFFSERKIETMYNVVHKKAELTRSVPEKLKYIVYRSLEKEREKRFSNFQEIKNELLGIKNSEHKKPDSIQNPEISTEKINKTKFKTSNITNPTSDNEELGEIVDRIKKYTESTANTLLLKSSGLRKKTLYTLSVIILISVISWLIYSDKTNYTEQKVNTDSFKSRTYLRIDTFKI